MKKGIPLKNVMLADRMTDWYLSMRFLGMLLYVDCTWLGFYCKLLPCKEPSSFLEIYSVALTSARDIYQSTIFLFDT